MIGATATAVITFGGMEALSYASHRWLMHGPGMDWHRSHHAPSVARLERNDRFPACFSVVGIGLFVVASLGAGRVWPIAIGVTAYGAAYLCVHEIHIHRRLPGPTLRGRYLDWLRTAHAGHHRTGGEPYGMLLPIRRPPAEDPRPNAELRLTRVPRREPAAD
ncbi:MAG: sterol desaturase family protein [Acidimicrobiales bacterium]|nr:sterol desaturase family protein [Acidimicrobiales bacterium]